MLKKRGKKCKECEDFVDHKCKYTKRKQNTIPLKILIQDISPSWCPFERIRIKKRKHSKRWLLTKQLDALWALLVKLKAGNKCEKGGKTTYLNSHHIFARGNLSVRWDSDNGVCLQAGEHLLKKDSAHKSPIEFIEWLKEHRGIEWYNNLREKAKQIKKWTIEDLEDMKSELEKEIDKCRK